MESEIETELEMISIQERSFICITNCCRAGERPLRINTRSKDKRKKNESEKKKINKESEKRKKRIIKT
jgi:hypothetical protein